MWQTNLNHTWLRRVVQVLQDGVDFCVGNSLAGNRMPHGFGQDKLQLAAAHLFVAAHRFKHCFPLLGCEFDTDGQPSLFQKIRDSGGIFFR